MSSSWVQLLVGRGVVGVASVSLSVGVVLDVEGGGVAEESFEEGDGEDCVWEDFVLAPVAFIAGWGDAFLGGVAFVDGFEQEGRVFLLQGLETDFVLGLPVIVPGRIPTMVESAALRIVTRPCPR